jgi:hypothetical protein
MGPFDRNFGNDYDREFGRTDWGNRQFRGGYNAGPWRNDQPMHGNMGYDRGFRTDFGGEHFGREYRGGNMGYDRGFRGHSHMNEPFPVRPSHTSMPMSRRGSGYDHGYFGSDYDREMRAGGRDFRRSRYDANFGDFRNSYLTGWF